MSLSRSNPLVVGVADPRPRWLETDRAREQLAKIGIELVSAGDSSAQVLHVPARRTLAPPKGARVVVEQGGGLVGARRRAAQVMTIPAVQAVDLEQFQPEASLAERRGRDLRMHRRFHRLAGPVILHVGPFTPDGGLISAIEATLELSGEFPDVRLAALCDGPLDHRHLGRCERLAMPLGHRCIVVRRPAEDELALWFGVASLAVSTGDSSQSLRPALLAAAAGVPFVCPAPPLPGYPSVTPATPARLLRDEQERQRLGAAARRWAETNLDAGAGVETLGEAWLAAAGRAPQRRESGDASPASAASPSAAAEPSYSSAMNPS